MVGSGVRVPLRFAPNFKVRGGPKGQASVSLFPGAIVALKGRNGGGGWFSVNEVLSVRIFISSIRIDISLMFSCPACSRLPRMTKGRSKNPEIRRSLWQ
jgi:hypothetical protein